MPIQQTKQTPTLMKLFLGLLIIGYTAFFTVQLTRHYYSFGSRALDLGNMGQTIWNTAQGRFFHQTNQPGAVSRLSLHVEPILIPISLLYHLYSGPEVLFLFQSFLVALGVIPVYALARFKCHSDGLAGLFAVVFLMLPAIQGATLLDFHAVTLAPTFLLAAFYYLETERPRWFALFAVLAVSCKEDMTLLVMMLGFYALLINRQYKIGLVTIGLCGIWTVLAVFVIPPLFAGTDNIHWNRFDHLGDSPLNIVLNLFFEPHRYWSHLVAVDALGYFQKLLAPTAFIALLNPVTLLLALPSLGINLLSNFSPMQRVNSLIYAAPIVPAVIISSIYGLANLKRLLQFWWPRLQDHRPIVNATLGLAILTASLIYQTQYGYLPGGGQFRGWEEITDHHRRAASIITQIPPTAKLSAQDRLNPHVSQRETLYIFDRLEDADHILLDITEDSWPLHPVELRHRVDDFLRGEFGIVAAEDGYLLLAKNRPDLPRTLPATFFDFARATKPIEPQYPTNIIFGDKLHLLGYDVTIGARQEYLPIVTLYWQALEPLPKDYSLWPFFINRQGQLIEDPTERPLVTTLWYPTSHWSPDEIIITRTLPWDLGDFFTLAVGVSEGSWSDYTNRLPVTKMAEAWYTFENETWVRLNSFQRRNRQQYEALSFLDRHDDPAPLAQFWHIITLQGVDIPRTIIHDNEPLSFTLYWQTAAPISVDLQTFAHLQNEDDQTVAQLDWTPQDPLGYLPTTAWQPDRLVIDRQTLPVSAVPPGKYRLVVGWYYPVTGDRLPLTTPTATEANVVEIGRITIQ